MKVIADLQSVLLGSWATCLLDVHAAMLWHYALMMQTCPFAVQFDLEVRKQYQIEISNRFAALKNLNNDKDVNRTWENIKENIKTSAKESLGLHELNQHKPWFDDECLGFLDQRKWAKMQWVQD